MDGTIQDSWLRDADPRFLKLPTVSDIWERTAKNKASRGGRL
jgi:hypothetical protein